MNPDVFFTIASAAIVTLLTLGALFFVVPRLRRAERSDSNSRRR